MTIKLDAPDYLRLLNGGTQYRMVRLKDRAAQSRNNKALPPSMVTPTWREAREYGFHNWAAAHGALDQGFNTDYAERKTPIWYCHTGEQFRNEVDAHEIEDSYLNHTAWYCDMNGDGMCIGIVGQLTHGRYIAGYRLTDSGERVYFGNVYTDAVEAARAADHEAEKYAEVEREYDAKYQNASALRDRIDDQKRDVDRMFKLRHTVGHDDASSMRNLEWAIEELRASVALYESHYSDVEF